MKATSSLLGLSLLFCVPVHETRLATAAVTANPGNHHHDAPQLTLSDSTRLRLTDDEDDIGEATALHGSTLAFNPLEALHDGLEVMQNAWFALWVGTWPTAIDWTAAVVDTQLVSSLSTLSKALKSADDVAEYRDVENDVNRYFGQNVAYYFGEDAFSLRNQAYDDMLWVVLGWLESVKFIRTHSERHYCPVSYTKLASEPRGNGTARPWQGAQFIEAFSHRARIFYDISSNGWDESLCGGGMVWSPYLGPYKNAITNELFITASVGMYLYFPGDNNSAPFMVEEFPDAREPHDSSFLQAAVKGYDWLKNSGMQNHLGLYVDGFHVADWRDGGTKCDIRNDMVFTYNQGVILSGLRGLWEGTGNSTYLTDAHKLSRDVIRATGWSFSSQQPTSKHWAGIGRNGILEERCDAPGACSQDAQTFKGIFFHHLSLLCEPLPLEAMAPGKTVAADEVTARLHLQSCKEYAVWTAHNARAAVGTRDAEGKFGMWWGAHAADKAGDESVAELGEAVDYRNDYARLWDPLWLRGDGDGLPHDLEARRKTQERQRPPRGSSPAERDPNERGRGRTVETQSGGIAVLRCLWELLHLDSDTR